MAMKKKERSYPALQPRVSQSYLRIKKNTEIKVDRHSTTACGY